MGIGPSGIARRADNVPFAHLSLSTALTCPPANEKKLKCVRSRSKYLGQALRVNRQPSQSAGARTVFSVSVTSVPQVLYI
uniref:Uncharacterized protein n=1 Tax=Knipowitschia caucasica TaxID=637954 RepID=A0AAV2KVX5_KNICA